MDVIIYPYPNLWQDYVDKKGHKYLEISENIALFANYQTYRHTTSLYCGV